jgi:hypothetical protein
MSRCAVKGMGALIVAVALGLLVPTAAGAAKPKVTAQADISCSLSKGKVKFSPPLRTVPAPTTLTAKMQFSCGAGATGFSGVTVSRVKVTGIAAGTYGCADLDIGYPQLMTNGTMHLSYKWKAAGGKVLPTTVATANWALRGPTYLVFSGAAFPPPNPTILGSYSSRYPVIGGATGADLQGLCAGAKGLKKFTLSGGSLSFLQV